MLHTMLTGRITARKQGYVIRSDVKFDLADSAKVQSVSMNNETAKGKVILNLTDEETGRPLMGAEFELRDAAGKVISTMRTDAAGHAESSLAETATFKNGAYDSILIYHLVQTKNLEGYLPDTSDHEIRFEYADQNLCSERSHHLPRGNVLQNLPGGSC